MMPTKGIQLLLPASVACFAHIIFYFINKIMAPAGSFTLCRTRSRSFEKGLYLFLQ